MPFIATCVDAIGTVFWDRPSIVRTGRGRKVAPRRPEENAAGTPVQEVSDHGGSHGQRGRLLHDLFPARAHGSQRLEDEPRPTEIIDTTTVQIQQLRLPQHDGNLFQSGFYFHSQGAAPYSTNRKCYILIHFRCFVSRKP